MQFFMSFYDGQLNQQTCYSFTLLICYMVFNPVAVQFFLTTSSFLNFDGPNAFFPNHQAPLLWLQEGRKIPDTFYSWKLFLP